MGLAWVLGCSLQHHIAHQSALRRPATCYKAADLAVKFKRALQEDAPLELHMWGTNLYTGELLVDLHRPRKQLVTLQWVLFPYLQGLGHVCWGSPNPVLIWLCALLFSAAHHLPSEEAAAQCIPAPSTSTPRLACAGGHYDEYVADFHDWRPGPIDDDVWETPDVCRDHPDAMQAHHEDSGLRLEVARQAPNRHWGEYCSMQDSQHWRKGFKAGHREWRKRPWRPVNAVSWGS